MTDRSVLHLFLSPKSPPTIVTNGKRGEIVHRYLTYERSPPTSKTKSMFALGNHPGAKCVGSFRSITGKPDPGFPHRCLSR